MFRVPVGDRMRAGDVAEIQKQGILVAGSSQIGAVVAADAADLVAAAAAQRMEQRLGFDQSRRTNARGKIVVHYLPMTLVDRPERVLPGVVETGVVCFIASSLSQFLEREFVLLQVLGVPVPVVARCADGRQVRTLHAAGAARAKGSAAAVDAVARKTVVARDQPLAPIQPRAVRHADVRVARAAAGRSVFERDHRLRPVVDVAVGVGHLGRSSLSAMTDRTAEFPRIMHDVRVRSCGQARAFDRRLFARRHPHVAGNATVRDIQLGRYHLPQPHLGRAGGGSRGDLDLPPVFQEVLLHRRRDQQQQHAQTGPEQ